MRYVIAAFAAGVCALGLTACAASESATTDTSSVSSSSVASTPSTVPSSTTPSVTTTTLIIEPTPAAAGPSIGDPCIGADIGRRTTDAGGTPIICDNYVWVADKGQHARHPWTDEQQAWSDCIRIHSAEECRAMLHGDTATTTPPADVPTT